MSPTVRSSIKRPVGSLTAVVLAMCAGMPAIADVSPNATMLRFPDISATHIVFSYANDLWLVPREGGVAVPLASPPGAESLPRFSPDGKTIAFVGNYDGSRDIYTVPVSGGVPTRVTYGPGGKTISDWTPDGKSLLFATNAFAGLQRTQQLWTVPVTGGMPSKLVMPYGAVGSLNADSSSIAYLTHSTDTRTWKRYRGGMATDIWLYNLKDNSAKKITDWEGTDTAPMYLGDKVYYLSDNGPEHRLNVWVYDNKSGKREQVTDFKDDDVKWPSMGPGPNGKGEIVFQLGSKLRRLDLDNRKSVEVNISIPGARPTLRNVSKNAGGNMGGATISPSGKRVIVEARGDLWSAPAKEGAVRPLTQTSGIAERDPSWSPDGKWIAYFSDETGENELWVRPADARPEEKKDEKKDDKKGDAKDSDGKKDDAKKDDSKKDEDKKADATKEGDSKDEPKKEYVKPADPRKLTNLGAGYRFNPTWSPDSKTITMTDQAGRLIMVDVESGTATTLDQDPWSSRIDVSWSHDSKWFAYARGDEKANSRAIWLYNVTNKTKTQVTNIMFNSDSPTFDRKGEFLYFKSSRKISDPAYSDIDGTFVYQGSEQLFMTPLRKDVKSPFAVKSDEENYKPEEPPKNETKKDETKKEEAKKEEDKKEEPKDEKKDDAKAESKTDDKKSDDKKSGKKDEKKPDPLKIDIDGFERRAIALPVDAGSFGGLAVADSGALLYVRFPLPNSGDKLAIKVFDPKADEKEEKLVVAESGGFALSADGKKLLFFKDGIQVGDPSAGAGKPTKVPTGQLVSNVDPRAEWKQIFTDAWRVMRDYFYEPTMHGVDWAKQREHYGAMIDDCVTREDVNYVISEMISELNIGHAYLGNPGDVEGQGFVGVGLLGADYELVKSGDGAAFKITKIYSGGEFDTDARSPLLAQGVDVKVGEYILAVNGVPLDTSRDIWASFQRTADKTIALTIGKNPKIDSESREVLIKPIGSEVGLRYRDFIEHNRQYVLEKSGGKVGYIYVPNTGVDGQNDLFRQFFGQAHMDALIIDERWNGGGQIPNRFIELLNRPVTNYWAKRDGNDWTWPPNAHYGPKCMLANGLAGSGGDMFPWLFKHHKIGKVLGMRTWGGLVGISGNPNFIDGGSITVPTFGFYETDGTWAVEGHGTDPDIEVVDDPSKMLNGNDPQLNAAIDLMLSEIKERGYKAPKRPASPNRSGMGSRPEDH